MNLFAYGFRPHFLLAGLAAVLLVPLWALEFVAGVAIGGNWPPTLWHAHEMLYGFIGAAIAGFLLTAVPSWTQHRGFAGRPLVLLSILWLLGRVLVATSAHWPAWMVASADLAFLPAVGMLIGAPLLRARNRNFPLLAVLGLLWACNLVCHAAIARHNAPLALHALHVGIDLTLVLITVIGGRIVPAFTAAALRSHDSPVAVRTAPLLSTLAILAMLALTIGDWLGAGARVNGILAGTAAVLQAARLMQWKSTSVLRQPIVWVLHLAYAWLPLGLGLKAIALLSGAAFAAFWLHALTVGALATMILAVMTRAPLGHTGRPLQVSPLTTLAYLLLTAAATVRVFGLALLHVAYPLIVVWAAVLWTAAFVLFVAVYAPILYQPRIDGKPG